MMARVWWRPIFPGWPWSFPETTHDPDGDAIQNRAVPAIYRFHLAAYGYRKSFQSGSSPYSLRSILRRPSCAAATARGRPVRIAASSRSDTGNHHLQPATRQSSGTKRALASAIGLPMRSTSALWMLVLLMPAEVRRSFIIAKME